VRALTPGESAWLVLLPCAALLTVAIVALGPSLGHLLFAPASSEAFWFQYVSDHVVRPESTEHARYALALLGPFLVGGGVVALTRGRSLKPATTARLVLLAGLALWAFLVVCVVYQHQHTYDASYIGTPFRRTYFTWPALAMGIAVGLLSVEAVRRYATPERVAWLTRETTPRRVAVLVVAALFVLVWLLSAFNTEGTIGNANSAVEGNVPFWIDEPFSLLNGQAPLVDFHAQYGQLWAYMAAGALSLLGTSFGVYASVMLAGTAATLLALFATLRRVVGSSLATLLLFVPLVANGFTMEQGPLANRYGPANLFSLFPIRYAGPFLLLWLSAGHLRRPRSWHVVPLFVVAGLVAINNVEFGVPAFAATLLAVAWAAPRRSLPGLARLGGSAAAGLAGAAALVAVLTLAVAGSLPHFGMLTTFPRIYGIDGFGLLPMPVLGLHLVVYVTFAAAIVVAIVRGVSGEGDAVLTGTLAWAGVFGLGAGGYFAGRSHPDVLIDLFSAWSLAISLLLVVAVRAMLRRPARRPTVAELALFVGFGITTCSLAQTPTPWSQLHRLRQSTPTPELTANATERLVARITRKGEPVAILIELGHRIAYDVGIKDVTPYANLESMLTKAQWQETLAALRAAHGRKILVPHERLLPEQVETLKSEGYALVLDAKRVGVIEFLRR